MRVFIHESVSAGDLGPNVAPSLRREGEAMRSAITADFQRAPGVEVMTQITKGCVPFFALVIAPEFEGWLERRSQEVLDAGGRLLGSLPAAIWLTGDKLATADHWRQFGVPHPRTQPVNDDSPTFPCVLKPRFGAGSQATFLVRHPDDLSRCIRSAHDEWPRGDFLVQQFVPGQHASVALLVGPAQAVPLLPARQHLSDDGRFRYLGGSLPLPESLARRAVALASQAVRGIDGLQGYVGVDLVLGNDGDDYVIEINPRLTTSYLGLRQLCRDNLAELILCCALGQKIQTPAWNAGEVQFCADALR